MTNSKLLIANRGEIAIRIARSAFRMGIPTVGVFAPDDANNLHIKRVDQAVQLSRKGVSAYLNIEELIQIAVDQSCTMVHPGYGFLSENPAFAEACVQAGLTFVGPQPEVLKRLGDKAASKRLAQSIGVPVIEGEKETVDLEGAKAFMTKMQDFPVVLKAKAGGGGRGMKIVRSIEDLETAFQTCQAEAEKAFGNGDLLIEKYVQQAQHIEIQVIGDGVNYLSLGERACSIQRRHQKLVEWSPATDLSDALRQQIEASALQLAESLQLESLCTMEFLVEGLEMHADTSYYFLEANPRIQVEHTITEMRFGFDLVDIQLRLAMGQHLQDQQLLEGSLKHQYDWAIQFRINAESYLANGQPISESGQITRLEWPLDPQVRIDTHAYLGYEQSIQFDSLLGKLIVYGDGTAKDMLHAAKRMLALTKIEGLTTNLPLLTALMEHPGLNELKVDNAFLSRCLNDLLQKEEEKNTLHFSSDGSQKEHHKSPQIIVPEGQETITSQMPGSVVEISLTEGQVIKKGQTLMIVEAMKMETLIQSEVHGMITKVIANQGDILKKGQAIAFISPINELDGTEEAVKSLDPNFIRPDLQELIDRKKYLLDENRPDAVAKRAKTHQRTARANINDLCDPESFKEYGGLTIAAQRKRRSLEDLVAKTPADGLITGIGKINGDLFDEANASAMIMAYDYTVLAGTQGTMNHMKMDRMLHLAEKWKMPIVLFAEGGGGRPGDVDFPIIAGLNVPTFSTFARLSGKQPRVAIVSRYCFAGNAALAGCADVIIATKDVSMGMGGPAMIEGGGLGVYHPKEVGPASTQTQNGVIDVLVENEAMAVQICKQYLSYFQGATRDWTCPDQRLLRQVIPENRRRVYDIRMVIEGLVDTDSFLELRKQFGIGIITGLIRIEGRPLGLIANNPAHLGGAIDADGADKMARFMQLCDAFGLPIVSLVDTPGIMVGPDAEKGATIRHASRLFVLGSTLKVPYFSVVLRKGYGLGAMAMSAGTFHGPVWTVAWPSGEFGAMGLEGAVRLGFKKELEQAGDVAAQVELYEKLVAKMYQRGKGINLASYLEIDDVIDPKDTRSWLVTGLDSIPKEQYQQGSGRVLDTW
ncbi:MAG: carboxyl transferase domain-containing protein [Bacteroidota bacterium]